MESINYHLELTPAQLKITHTALRSLLDDSVPPLELSPHHAAHARGVRVAEGAVQSHHAVLGEI